MRTRFRRFMDWVAEGTSRRGFIGWLGAGAASLVAWLSGGRSLSVAQDNGRGNGGTDRAACPGPFTQFGFGSVQGGCDSSTQDEALRLAHTNALSRATTMCETKGCTNNLLEEDVFPPRCQSLTRRDGSGECFCTVYDKYACQTNGG